MNYSVDRVVNGIAVCQNLDNSLIFEIDIEDIGFDVKDGDIISYVDGKYILNNELKEDRLKTIKDKFEQVKKF